MTPTHKENARCIILVENRNLGFLLSPKNVFILVEKKLVPFIHWKFHDFLRKKIALSPSINLGEAKKNPVCGTSGCFQK